MERLFEIKKTQIEMIQDRGYDVNKEELSLLKHDFNYFLDYLKSKNENREIVRSNLSQIYSHNGKKHLFVVFAEKSQDSKQISIEVIRNIIEKSKAAKIKELILIVEIPLSPPATKDLNLSGFKYQIFFDINLSYNPTRHVDNARHELLSQKEAEQKLKELKADVSKLLIIKSTDPIVQYYNWSVGGIVRVFREDYSISILTPKSINYRVIVA